MRAFPDPTAKVDKDLVERVTAAARAADNIRSAPYSAVAQSYLTWVLETERALSSSFPHAELTAALRTGVYWAALGATGADQRAQVSATVFDELEGMARTLHELADSLSGTIARWGSVMRFIVPDTDVFLHGPSPKLEELNWHQLARVPPVMRLSVVVPMLVIDQLDRHKDRRSGKPTDNTSRWRARTFLKQFRSLFEAAPMAPAQLHRAVQIELLVDDLSHVRLDDEDSELIDRCLKVARLSGRPVTFLTGDTGAMLRARAVELDAVLVDTKDHDEATIDAASTHGA